MKKQLSILKSCINVEKILITLFFISLLYAGCIKIPDDKTPITLTVNPRSIQFTSSGSSQTFTVNSNSNWSVSGGTSWLTVSPSSGYDNKTVTVTADRNTSSSSRNATITVRSDVPGVTAENITVTQEEETTLSVSPGSLSFTFSGEAKTITVTSNNRWSISTNANWLTISPSTGNGARTVTVTASRNTSSFSRNATITVRSDVSGVSAQNITVTQEEGFSLSVSPGSLSFTSSGESKTLSVYSNTGWSINRGGASWLTISPMTGNGDRTVTVTASRNTSSSSRYATITFTSDVPGVEDQNITVTQAEVTTLSVSPGSLSFTYSGESKTFSVSSNNGWSISGAPSWLTVSPTTGNGNRTVTVTASRNTSSSSRNATITVRSDVSGVSAQNITVTQAGAPTTAQVRFRKDGAYSDYTRMGIENSSGTLVASYNFGSSSGTSSYYSVTAGTYYPVYYRSSNSWVYFYYPDGSRGYDILNAGYRYTIRLYRNNSGGYTSTTENDGAF